MEKITVTPELREWAANKWGCRFLPDAALKDFTDYHEDRIIQKRPAKYADWGKAFQRYIRQNSPAGPFYGRQWDLWLAAAKTLDLARRTSAKPVYTPQDYTQLEKPTVRAVDIARACLAKMKANMGEA